jgi:hypothetical protein
LPSGLVSIPALSFGSVAPALSFGSVAPASTTGLFYETFSTIGFFLAIE